MKKHLLQDVDDISVILVDSDDNEIGTMPKLEAHETGMLHRAISVFLFDEDKNWILQRRADHKYHSAGKWSNTACSHPYPGEDAVDAAHRRLKEEMGMQTPIEKAFTFQYQIELENNLQEHELDHIFIGVCNIEPEINSMEVSQWRAVSFDQLSAEIEEDPERFSGWFLLLYQQVWKFVNR